MPQYLPKDTVPEFELPPSGTHLAVCYRVIDLGTQEQEWQGQTKHYRKIMLSWELPNERMSDGRCFSIHQRYTFSSSERAILRQHLESWRGRKFQDSDFGPGGFSIRNILGKGCMLAIAHDAGKNGRTYANIKAVVPMPKGTKTADAENGIIYFDLDEFSNEVFDALSQSLQAIIVKSPEYRDATNPPDNGNAPSYDSPHGPAGLDDEIPF